jgi:hypothetical protein
VALVLLLLTGVFFWPQVGQGRALYWGDIGLYFTPMAQFLHSNLSQGHLPLWNPLILCGTPYVGNPQTWPLYPLTALLPFVSAPYFLSLTVAVHVWLAGMGTYVFGRRSLDLKPGPALLGAVTFMFGGWLISKEQFPNMVQAASYLPWVLWAVDRVIWPNKEPPPTPPHPNKTQSRGRGKRANLTPPLSEGEVGWGSCLLGLILGLQLLAAHAQMMLWTLYLATAWGLFRFAQKRKANRTLRLPQNGGLGRTLSQFALAGVVAFGLSAGQVLPTLQLFHDGWRQNLSFHVVNRFYLPLNQTANWVLPTLHGHPYWGNFTARGNFWETCCYVGWLPFILAIVGSIGAFRRRGASESRFWLGAFIVGVLMALGGGAESLPGPYWLAYKLLPGFHSFHDPARCLLWSSFALGLLAASGLQGVSDAPRIGGRGLIIAAVVLLAFLDLTHFGRTIYPLAAPGRLFPMTRTITALKTDPEIEAHQARFLAPDSARVWEQFSSHKDYRQGIPNYQSLWADTLTPNLPMAYDLPDAYGYEPVTQRDAQQVLGGLDSAFRTNAPRAERRLAAAEAGFLGVRFVATDQVKPPEASLTGLMPLFSDPSLLLSDHKPGAKSNRVFLSLNTHWQPRARLVESLWGQGSPLPALSQMSGRGFQILSEPFPNREGTGGLPPGVGLSSGLRPGYSAARITLDTPDQVVIQANNNAGRPYLLLADTLSPGWTATVDGQFVPIIRDAGFLRAVALPNPGPHTVVFRYRPVMFLLGLYLTMLTVGGLLGSAIFGFAVRNRRIFEQAR